MCVCVAVGCLLHVHLKITNKTHEERPELSPRPRHRSAAWEQAWSRASYTSWAAGAGRSGHAAPGLSASPGCGFPGCCQVQLNPCRFNVFIFSVITDFRSQSGRWLLIDAGWYWPSTLEYVHLIYFKWYSRFWGGLFLRGSKDAYSDVSIKYV